MGQTRYEIFTGAGRHCLNGSAFVSFKTTILFLKKKKQSSRRIGKWYTCLEQYIDSMEAFVKRIDQITRTQVVQNVGERMAVPSFSVRRWTPSHSVIVSRSYLFIYFFFRNETKLEMQ